MNACCTNEHYCSLHKPSSMPRHTDSHVLILPPGVASHHSNSFKPLENFQTQLINIKMSWLCIVDLRGEGFLISGYSWNSWAEDHKVQREAAQERRRRYAWRGAAVPGWRESWSGWRKGSYADSREASRLYHPHSDGKLILEHCGKITVC